MARTVFPGKVVVVNGPTARRWAVLALDLDGTLLDPAGAVSPGVRAALARAVAAGIRPVLCTGRRFRRTLPIAWSIRLDAPLVCHSGALIKRPDERTVWRADWDRDLFEEVVAVFRRHDQPAISFHDRPEAEPDFVVDVARTGRPLIDDFLDGNRRHAEVAPAWADDPTRTHFHLTAIGTRPAMLDLEGAIHEALGDRVQTFVQKSPSYAGTMCEVLRADANKWAAIGIVCDAWGVPLDRVVAVGDDMNDIPMIRGAGLGVAMGHAPDVVRAAADLVIATNADDGVARLIDDVLLSGASDRPPGSDPA